MKPLIAVATLIGIPGSGKTNLAGKVLELSKSGELEVGVIVIHFDDFIKIDFEEVNEGDYKKSRESLMNLIKELIEKLNENEWQQIIKLPQIHFNLKPNSQTLIILDDNMNYRSMRQQVRAICRTTNCQHFQIFMNISLEEAKERNRLRSTKVPENVIEKMFLNFDVPVNSRTIVLEKNYTIETLLNMLKDRLRNPENLEIIEQQKIPQQQTLIHEIDLMTRKELNERIKTLKGTENFSQICFELNRKRKEFLDELKLKSLSTVDIDSFRTAFNCFLDE
jgi:tRNA uridine 5-carbamoylmethylation protein Kti12